MAQQIYVNLPVKDLKKAMTFFGELGFKFNPRFTDDKGACMIIGDNIFTMLLSESFFKTFTSKPVADAKKTTESIVCFNVPTRARVDELVKLAVKAGGTAPSQPQDHGFMYQHGFEDIDGHIWEVVHLQEGAS
jgi:predicted lactoylglutathione lyase